MWKAGEMQVPGCHKGAVFRTATARTKLLDVFKLDIISAGGYLFQTWDMLWLMSPSLLSRGIRDDPYVS